MAAIYSRGVTLAECVNLWLKETGWKKKDVAARAGMPATKLSEIINGKNDDPQWSTVQKLAKGFEVTPSRFLDGPSPDEEPGNAKSGRRKRNQILEDRWGPMLEALDGEMPAEDSWRGDVLKAVAALNRALRRADPGAAVANPEKARR